MKERRKEKSKKRKGVNYLTTKGRWERIEYTTFSLFLI
jgi:hypothetical protein